jgi:hypothetical protein
MEKDKTNSQFAELLDASLKHIQKHRRLTGNAPVTERYRISLPDALVCSSLSQRYQEVVLTKKHLDSTRIIASSKSIRADYELRKLMAGIPELSTFGPGSGDPGLFLLRKKMILPGEPTNGESKSLLVFDCIEEAEELFICVITYRFYTKRKKKLIAEFSAAELKMKAIAEQYHLPFRLSYNAFIDPANRLPVGGKPSMDFLNDYGTPPDEAMAKGEEEAQSETEEAAEEKTEEGSAADSPRTEEDEEEDEAVWSDQ